MTGCANYIIPRVIRAFEPEGAYLAIAILQDEYGEKLDGAIYHEGNLFIVADASIYNRMELGEKLGTIFSPEDNSDARLILKCFIKWNKACVNYLYGDFAFVIFNSITGEIFSARDHFGIRPLFYLYQQGLFFFSSELRLIKAVKKPQERPEYLLETLITSKTEKKLTPFRDVFRLLPAHFLTVIGSNLELGQYWDLNPAFELKLSTEQEYSEYFRIKLVNAVKMRTSETGKLATELSGGLDSSSITGIAADVCLKEGQRLKAYSNMFPDNTGIQFNDEREFINEMRKFKEFDWHGVEGLNYNIPDLLRYTLTIQGTPIQQNFSIFNRGIYEAAAKDNIHILLSGFGGDELVSSTIAFPWNEMIRKKQWKHIINELYGQGITLRSIIKPAFVLLRYFRSRNNKSAFRTGVFHTDLLEHRFANLPLQSDFVLRHSLREQFIKIFRKQKCNNISQMQHDRIMMDHVAQRMEYCYAAAAQYGIEYRYPLLDIDLVQTVLSVPAWLKQRHGINRYLFRKSVIGIIPEKIRLRNDKSGSPIPHKYYRLVKDHEEIIALINSASASPLNGEIFDFNKFISWYERLVKRDPVDRKYLLPGAFNTYLMIILYYLGHPEPGTQ